MIRIIKCCICHRMSRANLIFRGTNICLECETKIMNAKTGLGDYGKYKEGIKGALYRAYVN